MVFAVKPVLPAIDANVAAAIHRVLSTGKGHWRGSFSPQRIERALSVAVVPGKILGRGEKRLSSRQRAEMARATMAKAKTAAPTTAAPMTSSSRARALTSAAPRTPAVSVPRPPSSSLTPDEIARRRDQSLKRARLSRGKGDHVPEDAPLKRSRVGTPPTAEREAPVGNDASASVRLSAPGCVFPLAGGLLREEAYTLTKSKASELLLHLNQLVGDYDKDVRTREGELSEAKEANTALQSKLDELAQRNKDLESGILSAKRSEKELGIKLAEVESGRAKDKSDIALLKSQLDFAYDHQDARVDEAVAKARDEMTCNFDGRVNELSRLLMEIDGKAKEDMLDLAEIDANLEFIGLLQKPDPPALKDEIMDLYQRQAPIYDARNVFADLVAKARRVLGTPDAYTATGDDGAAAVTDDGGGDVDDEEIDE